MAKTKKDLLTVLAQLSLNPAEQVVVDRAIQRLKTTHDNETVVLGSLESGFRRLALEQKLSEQGLEFFTELQKPDFARDNGIMWSMWLSALR